MLSFSNFFNTKFLDKYKKNIYLKMAIPVLIIFSFIKLYGYLGPCVPSVLMVFADTPNDLKCGSSNPNIIEIGNMTTTRFSYQPGVTSFDDVFSKVATTVNGEADVVMNTGGLSVGTEVYVQGRYYTQEYYDSYDNLINSNSRFEPFGSGNGDTNGNGNGDGFGSGNGYDQGDNPGQSGASGYSLYPNSISNSQFYLDNTQGINAGCANNYSASCLDGTYSESVEYNPDFKSIPIDNSSAVDYRQSDYTPPESVESENKDNALDKEIASSNPNGSSKQTANPSLSPGLAQWKLQKIVESFNSYNDAVDRSEQNTKQFEQERKELFDDYRQQIQALENYASGLKTSYQETLENIDSYLEDYDSPPYTQRTSDYFTLPTQFEYHKLDGQARQILEAQLQTALDKKNAREYSRIAEKLMNANDYKLSRSKVLVNDSGILNSNLFDLNKSYNRLDKLDLSKVSSAHNRELLRSVANKYQAYWAELGGLEAASPEQILLYSVGAELLNSALEAAKLGQNIDFLTNLDGSLALLESTAKFNLGVASGLGNKLADKIMEIPELAVLVYDNFGKIPTTQEEWVKFAELVVRSAPGFKQAVIDGVIQYREDFIHGDEFIKGEVVGYIIGEALDTFVPAGKITSVSRIMTKASDVENMARLADKLTPGLAKALKALPPKQSAYLHNILIDTNKSSVDFVRNHSDQIVTKLVSVSDEDVLYAFDKLVASTVPYDAAKVGKGYGLIRGQEILINEKSVADTLSTLAKFSQKLNDIEGIEISGYISRVTETEYLSVGESAMNKHIGNLVVHGRYSPGGSKGIDVISYGIGSDEISSLAVSRLEAGANLSNLGLFSHAGNNATFNNVLDLTNPKVRDLLGVDFLNLISDSYLNTQAIGALAQKKGFIGVLAPSAKKPDGNILHIFGNQSL